MEMEYGITKQAFGDIKDALREYWFEVGEKQIIAAALLHAIVLLVCHAFQLQDRAIGTEIQILSVAVWCGFSAHLAAKWVEERGGRDGDFRFLSDTFVSVNDPRPKGRGLGGEVKSDPSSPS